MKIVFVAHEFGLFKGHGGVASYLYSVCKGFLDYSTCEIFVFTIASDDNCELLNNKRFHLIKFSGFDQIKDKLRDITADYVEFADYQGFGVETLVERSLNGGFENCIFAVHHHTASRECYEWNTSLPLRFAPQDIQNTFERERTQIMLADLQISPSSFFARYVKKNYDIQQDIVVLNHPSVIDLGSRNKSFSDFVDLSAFQSEFNVLCFTRFEGRKNQRLLINEFIKFLDEVCPSANLIMAGNSNPDLITGIDFRLKLFTEIPEKYRDRIHFIDFLDQRAMAELSKIGDVFVLASTFESFAIAVAEAIANGVPCVSSKYAGCSDFFGETLNSMTFDPFVQHDLFRVIKNFYNLAKADRVAIHDEQYLCLKKTTDMETSIRKRINLILEFLEQKKHNDVNDNFDRKTFIDLNVGLLGVDGVATRFDDRIALVSNAEDMPIVKKFLSSFRFNVNLYHKIIVLTNAYRHFPSAEAIVSSGCPLIFPSDFFSSTRLSYVDLLNGLILNSHQCIEIEISDRLACIPRKEFVNYTFVKSNSICFSSLI